MTPNLSYTGRDWTPGPWVSFDRDTASNIYSAGNDGSLLAVVHSYSHGMPGRPDKAQREANARLMAAAPQLYEALAATWHVLRAAGLLNLVNGVQLGQTSWYVKACDAEALSKAALLKALPLLDEGLGAARASRVHDGAQQPIASSTPHSDGGAG